jgi:hypothetical protein
MTNGKTQEGLVEETPEQQIEDLEGEDYLRD